MPRVVTGPQLEQTRFLDLQARRVESSELPKRPQAEWWERWLAKWNATCVQLSGSPMWKQGFQLRISATHEALTKAGCQVIVTQNKGEERRNFGMPFVQKHNFLST